MVEFKNGDISLHWYGNTIKPIPLINGKFETNIYYKVRANVSFDAKTRKVVVEKETPFKTTSKHGLKYSPKFKKWYFNDLTLGQNFMIIINKEI